MSASVAGVGERDVRRRRSLPDATLSHDGDIGLRAMNRRRLVFWLKLLMILTVGAFSSSCPSMAVAADQLTVDEIGKLEPELCQEASYSFRALTGGLLGLAGSGSWTQDMTPEQIALVDQPRGSGRRKVWILKIPAAFITSRTCDAGRKNWTGDGDYLRVSQIYDLDLLLLDGRVIAKTRATDQEKSSGIAVTVTLQNHVTDPQKLSQMYLEKSWVLGRPGVFGPSTCHEQPSNIAGLVAFKRINPSIRSFNDCGEQQNGVFAKKTDEGRYDFVMYCKVNCRIYRDYEGWSVEYSYDFRRLEKWESIHAQIRQLFDEWTVYVDHDS